MTAKMGIRLQTHAVTRAAFSILVGEQVLPGCRSKYLCFVKLQNFKNDKNKSSDKIKNENHFYHTLSNISHNRFVEFRRSHHLQKFRCMLEAQVKPTMISVLLKSVSIPGGSQAILKHDFGFEKHGLAAVGVEGWGEKEEGRPSSESWSK